MEAMIARLERQAAAGGGGEDDDIMAGTVIGDEMEEEDDLADMDAGDCAEDEDIDEAAEAAEVERMEAAAAGGGGHARAMATPARAWESAAAVPTSIAIPSSRHRGGHDSHRSQARHGGSHHRHSGGGSFSHHRRSAEPSRPVTKKGHMAFWDLHNEKSLHAGKRVCVIGGTTCGKTTAIHQIAGAMHNNSKKLGKGGIQYAIGFSKTERANGNLGGPVRDDEGEIQHRYSMMPSFCANHGFKEKKLAEFMQYQIDTKSVGRMKTSLVVMDDVMSQKGVKNSAILNEFMQNARNYGCGLIQGQHSVKQSSVDSRTQFHFVVCYELAQDQMKQFYDVFGSRIFPSFKSFRRTWMAMNKKLGKYWALVLDLQGSGALEKRVFKYKAKNPDDKDYHIPHLCQAGCWWIDRNLKVEAKATASIRELFDLANVANEKGIDMGANNALAMGSGGGVPASILLPVEGDDGGRGGTVLEAPPTVLELRV